MCYFGLHNSVVLPFTFLSDYCRRLCCVLEESDFLTFWTTLILNLNLNDKSVNFKTIVIMLPVIDMNVVLVCMFMMWFKDLSYFVLFL